MTGMDISNCLRLIARDESETATLSLPFQGERSARRPSALLVAIVVLLVPIGPMLPPPERGRIEVGFAGRSRNA